MQTDIAPGAQSDPQTDRLAAEHGLDLEALCARLHARHGATMGVKKPATATRNLARILTAALDLAGRKGFQGMTMRDLSTASGISMGALYAYIRDKETLLDLLLDVVTDAVERVLAHPPAEALADPARRLRWVVDRHVRLTEVMQPWFAFAYMEAKAFSPDARRRARAAELRTESLIAEALADGVARGAFRHLDVDMTAALLKPLLQDWYLKRWKYRARGITAADYVAAVMDLVDTGIQQLEDAQP